VKMCMKDLCSDTDRGKPKWSWKILLQWLHKSHIDLPGMGARPPRWESGECPLQALLYRRFAGFIRLSFCKSNVYVKMRMLRWWNDTDRGKPKWCGEKRVPCHFVHPKVVWADRRSNPSLSGEKPATEMDLRCMYSVCTSQKTQSVAIKKKSQWVYREVICVV
jgi:hypothetical protein